MKFLPPSMREKARYMAFKVFPINDVNEVNNIHFNFSDVSNSVLPAFKGLFGEFTLGKSNFWFLPRMWSPNENVGVIRIERNYVEHLRTSLLFVDKVNDEKVILKSLLVSGSLKKIREYLGLESVKK